MPNKLVPSTILLLISAAATFADNSANMTKPIDIPKVSLTEASPSNAWKKEGLAVSVFAGSDAEIKPFRRFGPTARVAWNDDGLIAHVHVIDSTPQEADDAHLYDGDSVELLLGTGNKADGMVQIVASPGYDGIHKSSRTQILDYRSHTLMQSGLATGKATSERTKDGYNINLFLPWANINSVPKDGDTIRVRVSINDAESHRDRTRLSWVPTGQGYGWEDLVPVRLGDRANADMQMTAWGGYADDLRYGYVNVVADKSLSGNDITVMESGNEVGKAKLQTDGERSVTTLHLTVPPMGHKRGDLNVSLNTEYIGTVSMPDIDSIRKSRFMSSVGDDGKGDRSGDMKFQFKSTVFDVDDFPKAGYPDTRRVEDLVGPIQTKVTYFDAAGTKVDHAASPGRYGAFVTVTSGAGITQGYYSLFRTPRGTHIPDDADPITMAADFEAQSDPSKAGADPVKLNRDWWHSVRKTLGTQVKYDYFVTTPKTYADDPAKKWPVVFYLHGSGGGEKLEDVQNGGIQIMAKSHDDFPFIAVSLRSYGGWYPPAVKDVMDEVEQKYHVDTNHEFLTGFSMGAMGTWAVAYDQPTHFVAIAPVGGRTGDPSKASLLKNLHIWIFNGEVDTATTLPDAKIAQEAVKNAGADVKFTILPNMGHVDSLNYVYNRMDLFDWFEGLVKG